MVRGKEYRTTLHRPLPNASKHTRKRIVQAFTIQALQKGTALQPPPSIDPYKEVLPRNPTLFRSSYSRGELPIAADPKRTSITWKVDIERIDYTHYLPIFFDGLSENEEPYKFIAQQGIADLLNKGGQKIFNVIPQLVIPIKNALHTKNKTIMCSTLRVLQHLVKSYDMIGEALVAYYRQLLPPLNLFKEKNVNCGDQIDYSQMKGENLADVINETLAILEEYGGDDAFINIKYLIPTYESAVRI